MVLLGVNPSQAQKKSTFLANLEQALNHPSEPEFSNFFGSQLSSELALRYSRLRTRFPDVRWSLESSRKLKDGRLVLEILINGNTQSREQNYTFESRQIVALRILNQKILDQELLFEESILRRKDELIPITLQIPDSVLTGSRYDVDVLFDNPLGDAIVAAGMIDLTSEQVYGDNQPEILLAPMHGGGLFKSVIAPLKPGKQTWAILLAHTDGIISVTKMVRVVSKEEDLVYKK